MKPQKRLSQLVFGSGDKVSFILDPPNQTLSCKINQNPSFVVIKDIYKEENLKWKMGMTLEFNGDSVTILNSYQHQ